ncbi:hypothetical protein F5B20DRAFT_320478 [Whalleya microplaca]|nr:hypothetical protein F5B20DRAFT_320478 [Whalleya microplaca]
MNKSPDHRCIEKKRMRGDWQSKGHKSINQTNQRFILRQGHTSNWTLSPREIPVANPRRPPECQLDIERFNLPRKSVVLLTYMLRCNRDNRGKRGKRGNRGQRVRKLDFQVGKPRRLEADADRPDRLHFDPHYIHGTSILRTYVRYVHTYIQYHRTGEDMYVCVCTYIHIQTWDGLSGLSRSQWAPPRAMGGDNWAGKGDLRAANLHSCTGPASQQNSFYYLDLHCNRSSHFIIGPF